MNNRTKAQLTVWLLGYFATVWNIYNKTIDATHIVNALGFAVLLLIVQLILSVVIIGILEWIQLFDLKTNAILTLIVVITIGITATL